MAPDRPRSVLPRQATNHAASRFFGPAAVAEHCGRDVVGPQNDKFELMVSQLFVIPSLRGIYSPRRVARVHARPRLASTRRRHDRLRPAAWASIDAAVASHPAG